MGISDLERIFRIYQYIRDFEKLHDVSFGFIPDSGETTQSNNTILINESGKWLKAAGITKPEWQKLKSEGFKPFVPDLIEWHNRIIIEYQEEPKPHKGPRIVQKGHDEFSDSTKDLYYEIAGFNQLKLWDSWDHDTQKKELFAFLSKYTDIQKDK